MEIQVHGKQIDVGDALRAHVTDRLADGVDKYFDSAVDGHVTLSRDAHLVRVDCGVHVGHGIRLQSHGEASDPYAAFDQALERIEKRLRRYKRRLKDHHRRKTSGEKAEMEMIRAASYVLAGEDEDAAAEPVEDQPIIIAEAMTEIPMATVGEAVMRMDLADASVMMFRNAGHGGLNVVYKRPDGNVGWIDPVDGTGKG